MRNIPRELRLEIRSLLRQTDVELTSELRTLADHLYAGGAEADEIAAALQEAAADLAAQEEAARSTVESLLAKGYSLEEIGDALVEHGTSVPVNLRRPKRPPERSTTGAPTPAPVVGVDDLLASREAVLRERMRTIALLAELEIRQDEVEALLAALGAIVRRLGVERGLEQIRYRYPSCFVASVAIAANVDTRGAETWPAVLDAMNLPDDGFTTSPMGKAFLACLDRLDLPTFPELDEERARVYVSRIHLHGGVPLDHLDEFFEVAVRGVRALASRDPEPLRSYLAERAQAGTLYGATVSVSRFLRFGGDYATDFLDRALDLLDQVAAGRSESEVEVALPPRYITRAIEIRDLGLLPNRPDVRGSGVLTQRPSVRFDPYGLGVHLELPGVLTPGGEVHWSVAIAGEARTVVTKSTRPGVPTEAAQIPLPATATEMAVARDGGEATVLRGVAPDDPTMLFGPSGEAISRATRLPRGLVWVVAPAEVEIAGARVVEEHPTVPRWAGWRAALVDLSDQVSVTVGGRRRLTSAATAAELAGGTTVEGVTTLDGAPVLSDWPALVLPPSAAPVDWEVSIEVEGAVRRETHTVGRDELRVPLAARERERREITVQARGPMGQSIRRSFCVVPNLGLIASTRVRGIDRAGAAAVRVSFSGQALPPLDLDSDMARGAVELDTGQVLLVEPPSVAVQYAADGVRTAWERRPLVRATEDIVEAPGTLIVRIPEARRAELVLVQTSGVVLTRIRPSGRPGPNGSLVFDLQRMVDELERHGAGILQIESDVWSGTVLRARPRRLVADVVTAGGGMLQAIGVAADGVQLGLYARFVPDRPPVVVEVDTGQTYFECPEPLAGLGPLRVLARVDDPWLPEPWPRIPLGGSNVFDIGAALDDDRLREATPFADYLLGGPLPDIDNAIGAAAALFREADVLPNIESGTVRREIGEALASRPTEVLRAAISEELPAADVAQLLVAADIVARDLGDDLTLDEAHQLMQVWPAAGVLALAGRYGRRDGTISDDVEVMIDNLLGDGFVELVVDGDGPCVGVPALDQPVYLSFTPEQLRHLRSAVALRPRYLLDVDDRSQDGFAILELLHDTASKVTLERVARHAEEVIVYNQKRFDELRWPESRALIHRRVHGSGLLAVPGLSLSLAIAARIAARLKRPEVVFTSKNRAVMLRLVSVLPRMVAADLVIAEALVQNRLEGHDQP